MSITEYHENGLDIYLDVKSKGYIFEIEGYAIPLFRRDMEELKELAKDNRKFDITYFFSQRYPNLFEEKIGWKDPNRMIERIIRFIRNFEAKEANEQVQ